jgi:adenylate cyclase class 2
MPSTTLEREIKLRFASAEEARQAIIDTGATPMLGRRLQEDALLDNDEEELRRRRCVLRVRTENGKSRLTFKGPVQPGAMKIREELETVVGDGAILLRVLEELGLHIWFRYEKYREEFAHEDVIVAIDETPVGTFVEIEGSEHGITALASALARSPADYVLDSYRSLFMRHLASSGLPPGDMLFETSEP